MTADDENKELDGTLKEFLERKVPPLETTACALISISSVIGSTILLRSQFAWPAHDLPAAGLLAAKDFVLITMIVTAFEARWKQKRYPIRYGIAVGSIFSLVAFVYWAFFS